jgi:hypothetical protein
MWGPAASPLAPPALKSPVKPASWIKVFLIGAVGICAGGALAYFVLLTGALTPWLAAPFLCGLAPAIFLSGVGARWRRRWSSASPPCRRLVLRWPSIFRPSAASSI